MQSIFVRPGDLILGCYRPIDPNLSRMNGRTLGSSFYRIVVLNALMLYLGVDEALYQQFHIKHLALLASGEIVEMEGHSFEVIQPLELCNG